MKEYHVYIVTNQTNKVMYIGMTNDLERRIYEHKHSLIEGFTKKYKLNRLVYCESCADVTQAIAREKQLKGWLRAKKNELVQSINPNWSDLSQSWS